ncbi:MAG TPA: glycosyltransferase family 1 protein [Gemmatimonadaceae bacterium]|jgi:glycosyltransferase involved in cell wall biosynthesis
MHLVVDARMINHSGIGVYLRNLLPRVASARPDWRVSAFLPAAEGRIPYGITPIACESDIYTLAEQRELVARMPRDVDLVWSPHYNVPLFTRAPWIVTIHDVAHLARPDGRGVVRASRLAYARFFLSQVRRRARRILFDSHFTRREFEHRVGAPRSAEVIHLGVDEKWKLTPDSVRVRPHDRPFIIFIGNVKPHKNLQRLLEAFALLAPRLPHDLVLVGAIAGLRSIDRTAMAAAKRLGDRVRLVGQVDDSVLQDFVSHADALVFPSLYEGFGLPPLEAMAAGVPCVVSDIPPVREMCGSAPVYFDPMDPCDMAVRIESVLLDPERRRRMIEDGRARIVDFSWESTARQTVEALAEVSIG